MTKFNHILEINTLEWFDKVNGNSYFSSRVVYDGELICVLPFQYGYGSHCIDQAFKKITSDNLIRGVKLYATNSRYFSYYNFCEAKKIKLIENKTENCLKREVMAHGEVDN